MIGSRKKFIIISSVLFILVSILIGFLIYIKIANMKIKLASKRKEIYSNAVSYCNSLYEDGIVKNDTTIKDLDDCLDKIKLVYNKDSILNVKNDVYRAKEYIKINNKINTYYKDNIVISSIKETDINILNKEADKLDDKYKTIIKNRINDLKNEYEKINDVRNIVNNLFSDYDNNIVIDDINRDKYDSVKTLVDSLKQEDIKNILNDKLTIVVTKI